MAGSFSHLFIILLLALLIRTVASVPDKNRKHVTPRRRYLPRFGRSVESSIPKPLTIHRCDCDETDGCVEEAYNKITQCKGACQNELIYFGANTEKYLSCFEENILEANVINECLDENAYGYCSLNGTMYELELELLRASDSSLNDTENNSTAAAASNKSTTAEPIEDADKVYNLIKKANLISLHFVKFETCVVNCLKNHVNTCLKDKECWIKIPKYSTMEVGLPSPPENRKSRGRGRPRNAKTFGDGETGIPGKSKSFGDGETGIPENSKSFGDGDTGRKNKSSI